MTNKNLKLVVNVETNEFEYRDFNEDELKQIAIDEETIGKRNQEEIAQNKAKEAAALSANEKLLNLGLTIEEIAALRG